MRLLLCTLLLAAACKSGDKPAASTDNAPTPTERQGSSAADHAKRHPSLPGAPPNVVNREDPRDWNDPAVREEMAKRRDEREKRMNEQLDTNHDGVVSPEEHHARVKPMFDRLDANADGKLTPDEIAASDRRMGFDDPAALDTDKDGQVSLAELDVAMQARRDKMREKWRGGGGRFGEDGSGAGAGSN